MFVSNSAVNPFTYAFFNRDIKKEIKKLVCRKTFKKDNRIEPFIEAIHVVLYEMYFAGHFLISCA